METNVRFKNSIYVARGGEILIVQEMAMRLGSKLFAHYRLGPVLIVK